MNTGADDDSRSTPTLAFSKSSACASPLAAIASRLANISRTNLVIQSPPTLFDPYRGLPIGGDQPPGWGILAIASRGNTGADRFIWIAWPVALRGQPVETAGQSPRSLTGHPSPCVFASSVQAPSAVILR